jgi:phage/plasmid-like protein (TIGR03299 family)
MRNPRYTVVSVANAAESFNSPSARSVGRRMIQKEVNKLAHELHINAGGKASIAYAGETPWHKLGQRLTPDAPLTVWLEEAGMNFEIKDGVVQTTIPGLTGQQRDGDAPTIITMPERKLLYRSDTLAPLAVVSAKYKVVQPREILYAQEELIEKLGFQMETAGVLFSGKKFWSMSKTNHDAEVVAGDPMGQYLMMVTACDGSLATTAKFVATRAVCNNTVSMALNENGKTTVKIPHSSTFDMDRVKAELGLHTDSWNLFLADMRKLASSKLAKNQSIIFLRDLLGDPTKSLEDQAPGAANLMQEIYELYDQTSIGNELAGHTRWGMLNAVTEYVDHHTGHKTDDARMNNAWYGDGDKLKSAAMDLLVATI